VSLTKHVTVKAANLDDAVAYVENQVSRTEAALLTVQWAGERGSSNGVTSYVLTVEGPDEVVTAATRYL
jgi:hypothetical protein